jgi:hypothetical protein
VLLAQHLLNQRQLPTQRAEHTQSTHHQHVHSRKVATLIINLQGGNMSEWGITISPKHQCQRTSLV